MDIDWWREKIDEIDRRLVELLNQRSECAMKIGEQKRLAGIEVYQPQREAEVIHNAIETNRGPLDHDAIKRLFERIIDESRRVERLSAEGKGSFGGERPQGETE